MISDSGDPVTADLERTLQIYAELTVKVGLNLQAGQRLLVIGPLASGGASLEAAPLVRRIAASAYRAGAPFVEVLWGDEPLLLARFQNAPRDSFSQFSRPRRSSRSPTRTGSTAW